MLRDDASDIPLTQLEHAFQTAEILREAHPKDDWLHLVGLIHGLGKLLRHAEYVPTGPAAPLNFTLSMLVMEFVSQRLKTYVAALSRALVLEWSPSGLSLGRRFQLAVASAR